MPTLKKRYNITLDRDTEKGVNSLAKHEGQPNSAVIAELTREALELREDIALGKIADRRESMKVRYVANRDEFWK